MNGLLRQPDKAGSISTELLFDWRADLERLETAAETARRTHDFDPWVLAEGECWLDLIEAELVAVNGAPMALGPSGLAWERATSNGCPIASLREEKSTLSDPSRT